MCITIILLVSLSLHIGNESENVHIEYINKDTTETDWDMWLLNNMWMFD